jgi:hypothetical protein
VILADDLRTLLACFRPRLSASKSAPPETKAAPMARRWIVVNAGGTPVFYTIRARNQTAMGPVLKGLPPLHIFDFSLSDLTAILRVLERDALALVATFPAEAAPLVRLAALLRAGGNQ